LGPYSIAGSSSKRASSRGQCTTEKKTYSGEEAGKRLLGNLIVRRLKKPGKK